MAARGRFQYAEIAQRRTDGAMTPEEEAVETREPDPVVRAYMRDVDRTLIRKNLALSHEERFRQLMELQKFAAELAAAGKRALER